MSSFANLKRGSSNLEILAQKIQEQTSQQADNDESNYWRPEVDKVGNGYAVIRFLPSPAVDGDDGLPWAKIYTHGFQGPGGWYIENSLTSFNEKDPVSEYNSELWNSGIEANKEVARKQKRRLTYVSNVYIVEDPKHPENNGKVFLYRYGKKIFDKLNDLMNPQFEDETPVNPFDFWEGANFRLKIREVEGYPNYDKSEFDSPSALFDGTEEKLEEIYKQLHSLKALHDTKNFKSYEELEARLHKALGITGSPRHQNSTANDMIDDELDMRKLAKATNAPSQKSAPQATAPVADDDSDDLAFFRSLANG
jgi:hypothetical protein